jgi:hypothetical protein
MIRDERFLVPVRRLLRPPANLPAVPAGLPIAWRNDAAAGGWWRGLTLNGHLPTDGATTTHSLGLCRGGKANCAKYQYKT